MDFKVLHDTHLAGDGMRGRFGRRGATPYHVAAIVGYRQALRDSWTQPPMRAIHATIREAILANFPDGLPWANCNRNVR